MVGGPTGGKDNAHAILKFEFPTVPDLATITAATLELYYYGTSGGDPVGRTYGAYRLTQTAWVEIEATWNSYRLGSAWAVGGGDYTATYEATQTIPAGYGWVSWNVLDQAIYAKLSTGKIAHFLIKDVTEDSLFYALFYSSEYVVDVLKCPKLTIEYTATPSIAGWQSEISTPTLPPIEINSY
jgi:hypothetical protein